MSVKLNKKFIEHMLVERGISARELSRQADVGEATMYRILGGASFNSVTLGKIAGALGCNPVDLIDTQGYADPLVGAPTAEVAFG